MKMSNLSSALSLAYKMKELESVCLRADAPDKILAELAYRITKLKCEYAYQAIEEGSISLTKAFEAGGIMDIGTPPAATGMKEVIA
jgi:hypothetical protein